jgi:hypothetical protein
MSDDNVCSVSTDPDKTDSITTNVPAGDPAAVAKPEIQRPLSNNAQIVQAFISAFQALLSLSALIVAGLVYLYTVIPAQQLVGAKEQIVVAENKLRDVNKQISEKNAQFKEIEAKTERLVIDEFIRLILSRTASIPRITTRPAPSGRSYGTERARMPLYFDALKTMFGEDIRYGLNVDYLQGQFTGHDVIEDVLAGPLISALPDQNRQAFVDEVHQFMAKYANQDAWNSKFAVPLYGSFEQVLEAFGPEEKRRIEVHRNFTAAIVALHTALLESPRLQP